MTPENLVAKGAARKGELIKVLGTGELGVALRVTAHAFSATAAAKIERGGRHGHRAFLTQPASQRRRCLDSVFPDSAAHGDEAGAAGGQASTAAFRRPWRGRYRARET